MNEATFLAAVRRNPVVVDVLARAEALALPGWYLTAGCLFQTVWNVLDGHDDPTRGIRDYDLFYFDDGDLSWAAEDAVIRRAAAAFAGCGGEVEVRNEARVHLWYEDHFGVPCPPYASSEAAIASFAATACCVGVRTEGGRAVVHAPFGFADLSAFVLRPNPVLAPREVYEAKAARWRALWPRLDVLPWPDPGPGPDATGGHGREIRAPRRSPAI
ncbi:MAG TPA: nucleotidyltransferase family protein [Acidimicrobiales bacterium]|nr:nucleotidyltransferase family protein [Acidimicrobiales bacterium]